jgi:hypothetical protein
MLQGLGKNASLRMNVLARVGGLTNELGGTPGCVW